MFPPVFEICASSSDVQTNLGSPITRLYAFGYSPDSPTYPYAVWQTITGSPENYLGQVPDIDQWTVQIDIYARTVLDARNAAQAVRDAIETQCHVTSLDDGGRDPDTLAYRYIITADWWDLRETSST